MEEFENGHIEVICGPMFCGKTEELIRRIKRVEISGKRFVIVKPTLDDRYDKEHIITHDKIALKSKTIENTKESLKALEKKIDASKTFLEVIAIDEGNFFDSYIVNLCKKWRAQGRRVIIAGLDTDFRNNSFGPMGELMAVSDYVDKLKAICMKCRKNPASRSQRIINGKPAPKDAPTILVGASENYEARCNRCYEEAK